MSLDPTSREANVMDSVKKYFVDNIYRTEGIEVTFDTSLATPILQGQNLNIDKWVAVIFGDIDYDTLSEMELLIFCCTRNDSEGFKLAQLRDKVMGYLTDATKTDCLARIPFYRSYSDRAWELLGSLVVFIEGSSQRINAPDGTKVRTIPVTLKWGAKP